MSEITTNLIELQDGYKYVIENMNKTEESTLIQLGFVRKDDKLERYFSGDFTDIDRIFSNFNAKLIMMIQHQNSELLTPWEEGLLNFLKLIPEEIDWWLLGSAALAVRGIDIIPRDIDIVTTANGAIEMGRKLEKYLVEPVFETDWIGRYFGRAYLKLRIEWVGDIQLNDPWVVQNYGPPVENRLELLNWRGFQIRVAPLDLLLKQSRARSLDSRVKKIEDFLGRVL